MEPIIPLPFKMFGLHRTGSNLMLALMLRNFRVHSLEPGTEWKHGPVQCPQRLWNGIPSRFIFCVRNPYAWLFSFYRYCRRSNGGDRTVAPQFQRDPSVSFEDFVLSPVYEFDSPIDRWNQMNRYWLDHLPPDRTVIVRQEDQLEDQIRVLEKVEQTLNLSRRRDCLEAIHERVDVNAQTAGPYNRDYYVDREYMAEYPTALLAHVNNQIDPLLMDRFRYPTESWTLATRQVHTMQITVRPCTSDAGDAREVALDAYRFERIRQSGQQIRNVVDVGAHVGAASVLARTLWPDCRVMAYEPCPENARVLRINVRRAGNVTAVQAAVTDGMQAEVPFSFASPPRNGWYATGTRRVGWGFDAVPAVTLEHAMNEWGGIDLLKIGCPDSLMPIVRQAAGGGLLEKVGWVCGRLPQEDCSDDLLRLLERTHVTQVYPLPQGKFFSARRIA